MKAQWKGLLPGTPWESCPGTRSLVFPCSWVHLQECPKMESDMQPSLAKKVWPWLLSLPATAPQWETAPLPIPGDCLHGWGALHKVTAATQAGALSKRTL